MVVHLGRSRGHVALRRLDRARRAALRAVEASAKSTDRSPPSGKFACVDGRPGKSPEATPRSTNLRVSSMSMIFMDSLAVVVPDLSDRPPEE